MEILGREKLSLLKDDVKREIKEVLNTDILELSLNKGETEKLKRERDKLRRAIRRCSMGDRESRDCVKEKIRELLERRKDCSSIKDLLKIISFDDFEKVPDRELFEYLYFDVGVGADEAFESLCECFGWPPDDGRECGYEIGPYDVRGAFALRALELSAVTVREVICQYIYEELFGFGAADILIMDRTVDGVSGGCGGCTEDQAILMHESAGTGRSRDYDTIYVMYKGRTVRLSFLSFESGKSLEQTVKKLCRNDARTALSRRTPMVVCQLLDDSRVVASRPPYSPSWVFYVRRFSSCESRDIESLITDSGKERVIRILKILAKSEQNFVISGNQGGGKTTLLKCLVQYIDSRYTIRVAESTFELGLNNLYPERNIHTLQERDKYTVYSSITAFKKMDTDVTILGEINEPKLAGAFVQITQNGGRMAVSTLHHNSTEKLIDYLRNALVSEFGITDIATAEKQVVDSVNFDVHMVRGKDGHHFVERITEIVPVEGSGNLGLCYECRDIVIFDQINRCYVVTGMLSDRSRSRIRETLGGRAVLDICGFLQREKGRIDSGLLETEGIA